VFSAARAHSRLRQAAAAAVCSITADLSQQKQVDSVLRYVDKHSRYVDSIHVRSFWSVILHQLPSNLQLSSLQLQGVRLQLLPGDDGSQGVLGAAAAVAALKTLRLRDCRLTDGEKWIAAALSPFCAVLQHLSIRNVSFHGLPVVFHTGVLQQMQQLTHLELASISAAGTERRRPALQDLQSLTRLVDLRLDRPGEGGDRPKVTANMLSGMQNLTRLDFCQLVLEPGALAGKPKLQHLQLITSYTDGSITEGMAQLLSRLQDLQQLTHLDFTGTLSAYAMEWGAPADDGSETYQERDRPPAAAYAALTASSKLQYLNISNCTLPAGVWQHMFPAGKQLPHLETLVMSGVSRPSGLSAAAPEGLVSCCPALRVLDMQSMRGSVKLLASLQGLSGLRILRLAPASSAWDELMEAEGFVAACRLTGLRELSLYTGYTPATREGLLRPLTQLQQLTRLYYEGARMFLRHKEINMSSEVNPNTIACADLVGYWI
jgi:hypothetical protein